MALVVIAAAVFCLTCCLWMLMSGKFRPAKAPPHVSEGPPIVGNLMGFALGPRGPLDFIKRNFEVHGGAYSMRVAHKTLTFLVGPKASAPFFQNRDDVFSQPEVYGFMTQVFGKGVVYDATPAKRKAQNVHMSRGLRADRLKSYIPKILMETKKYMGDRWAEDGACDVLKALSELTILTASRCLHGDDVRETLFEEVADIYHDLDKGITPCPSSGRRRPSRATGSATRPACAWSSSSAASSTRGARRRWSRRTRTDILQVFVDMKYKDGTMATTDEITGLLIALLFAGQHTSSITSTWTTLFILHDAKLKARLLEEQRQIFGAGDIRDAPMSFDDLNKMEILHNCVKETLRMHPPLIMLMRKAMQDVPIETDAGLKYVIPKGDIVFTSPAVAGRLDMVFKDPDAFDPDRYAAAQEHATPRISGGDRRGEAEIPAGDGDGDDDAGVAEAKVEVAEEAEVLVPTPSPDASAVPVALPVACCVDDSNVADEVAAPPPEPTPLWVASPADERGYVETREEAPARDDDESVERQFRLDLRRAVEESLRPSSFATRAGDDDEEKKDEGELEDVDASQAGSRRRRRWSYKAGDGGSLAHALDVEESFPTIHGTKYYVAQTKVLSDERVTISRVGRWFRDVRELASEPADDGDAGAGGLGRATADYPPEPGVARAAAAASAEPASPRDASTGARPAHADIDIGVGDLVRFRLRGAATVDEYGVVLWVSKASTDAGSRNAGAHVQVCTHACGMLVPRHEIAFGVSRLYGDVIDVLLKDFSMEIQLRPNKFLFIFEPDAVVFPTLAYSTGVDVHDGAAPGGAADGPGEGA
ncbi:sterol 14-demethylase [Aureococcus anophagefferens]|nr:sterol 14-demethylase [Aureococcus anophagefferens]